MATKLTADEIALRLRVTVQTVYAWVRSGKLPCQRLGHRPILFVEEEVEKALNKNRKTGRAR